MSELADCCVTGWQETAQTVTVMATALALLIMSIGMFCEVIWERQERREEKKWRENRQ